MENTVVKTPFAYVNYIAALGSVGIIKKQITPLIYDSMKQVITIDCEECTEIKHPDLSVIISGALTSISGIESKFTSIRGPVGPKVKRYIGLITNQKVLEYVKDKGIYNNEKLKIFKDFEDFSHFVLDQFNTLKIPKKYLPDLGPVFVKKFLKTLNITNKPESVPIVPGKQVT